MVLINEDGTEYVYESPLTEEIRDLLHQAGPNLLAAIRSACETYLTLNISPDVVGIEGAQVLAGLKFPLVFRLMLFRDHLLPLSKTTVRAVRETVSSFFLYASFEDFKKLLPTLKKKLEPHTKSTGVTKLKFMILSAEFKALEIQSKERLEEIIPQLKEKFQLQDRETRMLKKSAKRVDSLRVGGAVSAVGVSLCVAKGLLSTGGLIVAIPPLAPIVAGAGVYFANMISEEADKKKEQLEKDEKYLQTVHSELSKTIQTLEYINDQGIQRFASCMQGCSSFFAYIGSTLETLSSPDGVDDGDEVLEIMFRGLKAEASPIVKACRAYEANGNEVETATQVLEQFKLPQYEGDRAKWIKMSDEKAAELMRNR